MSLTLIPFSCLASSISARTVSPWRVVVAAIGVGTGGLIYDVVNRKGEIVERVRLPKGRALVGVGPDGVVYMVNANEKTALLERVRLR